MLSNEDRNLDQEVIDDFGREWSKFSYLDEESKSALEKQFQAYCRPLNLQEFEHKESVAADFGAGSGRWSGLFLQHFSKMFVLEPSDGAFEILKERFAQDSKVILLKETVGSNSIPDISLDLGISLGVLHHIPNTELAIKCISNKIKSGGYFLCYLYYKLEEKPYVYQLLYIFSDHLRKIISKFPYRIKKISANLIAVMVYFPLARISKILKHMGFDVQNVPLHHYADMPFRMLANDSLDRFGTKLEQRFSKSEIISMLKKSNFDISTLKFSDEEPFWTFSIRKN